MKLCCCLACIEGFGVCSSAPKTTIVIAKSTARGVSSFEPSSTRDELRALAVAFGVNPDNVQPWYEDKI